MPKKNTGQNAFYFFMLDWRKQQEKQGRKFSNLREVQSDPRLSEAWKALHPQQKGHYESLAKNSKLEAKTVKKTTLGESLDELERQRAQEEQFKEQMELYMDSIIHLAQQTNSLHKLKLYFIHVNWFYRRELDHNNAYYCPAEFAVAEFTMEHGIQRVYHELINVESEKGYTREAMEHSQNSHKIPLQLSEGESDFAVMYNKLIAFLRPEENGNKLPPLYTLDTFNSIVVQDAVESLLQKMCDAKNRSYQTAKFLLYPADVLFTKLLIAAARTKNELTLQKAENVVKFEFSKDVHRYAMGIECDYHKFIDTTAQYCSLSVVKRWGYTVCDYCFSYLDMELIPGTHCPKTTTIHNILNPIENGLNELSLKDKPDLKVMTMTGVTEDHRIRASERSYREEMFRRKTSQPITIIDHSKIDKTEPKPAPSSKPYQYTQPSQPTHMLERPLRLPRTACLADIVGEEEVPENNEDNFPAIGGGRGIILRGRKGHKSNPGVGHAKRMQ